MYSPRHSRIWHLPYIFTKAPLRQIITIFNVMWAELIWHTPGVILHHSVGNNKYLFDEEMTWSLTSSPQIMAAAPNWTCTSDFTEQFPCYLSWSSQPAGEAGSISPILQIRKWEVTEVKWLAQVYAATKWLREDLDPALSTPNPIPSPPRQARLADSGSQRNISQDRVRPYEPALHKSVTYSLPHTLCFWFCFCFKYSWFRM